MRAVILGGTGAIGGAAAARLAASGCEVEVTGRNPASMPAELPARGVHFHSIERSDVEAIGRLVGDDSALLVDLLAYRAADVRALLPAMGSVGSTVIISTRAVYVDADGRHVNGHDAPRFPVPITESMPTVRPADGVDPFSREGYAPSKVAVEQVALGSGLPITVIRPSKVHGRWARNPRTRSFVESMMRGEQKIELAARGESIDHLTAASNTAALIATVATLPGARILNSADPDAPSAEQIVRAIALRVGWNGALDLLGGAADPLRGRHPWMTAHPIVLDTSASTRLGYAPAGTGLALLAEEIDWIAAQ
ncbi:NAD-dependent epimerase/dehydratase family protein [Glaciihabitans sp. INWT7]|uniref:NAD-dependent epimerase/dehydratase family protein n=1 Tax=Glaciihabitans sp. INWT7 TaxID=2596912 RepID=UPI001627A20C|nr:NAD-dependent epimerase/dehydratase family protein [Glaciihabitans sp. INWT7]QNE47118.1 NAD-dependent epimerase/dehydratase family protein [Glaciihabitans sp. INWT7]